MKLQPQENEGNIQPEGQHDLRNEGTNAERQDSVPRGVRTSICEGT